MYKVQLNRTVFFEMIVRFLTLFLTTWPMFCEKSMHFSWIHGSPSLRKTSGNDHEVMFYGKYREKFFTSRILNQTLQESCKFHSLFFKNLASPIHCLQEPCNTVYKNNALTCNFLQDILQDFSRFIFFQPRECIEVFTCAGETMMEVLHESIEVLTESMVTPNMSSPLCSDQMSFEAFSSSSNCDWLTNT